MVLEAAEARGRIATLGPLIHNNQALAALAARGVRTVRDLDELGDGVVVIRAHGAGPTVREAIRSRGISIIDATCPRVVRCQKAVERAAAASRQVIIAGDPDHAEVEALLDFATRAAERPARMVAVVSSALEAERVELSPPVTLVAQTTFSSRAYAEIAEVLSRRLGRTLPEPGQGERDLARGAGDLEVVQSLCSSTEERQREAEEIAREVDAVVVVGGRHSANTRRLAELARAAHKPTFHVETAEELVESDLARFSTVGVTAGASTPAWATEQVVERLLGIGSPLRRGARRLLEALVGTNLLLAAAAAAVTLAATDIAGVRASPATLLIAFAYVFSAHAANRAGETETARLAGSGSSRFFHDHRRAILLSAAALSATALAAAFAVSAGAGVALLGALLFAALYSLPIFPARAGPWRLVRLRDIPASKDLAVALAWAFVAVAIPLAASGWEDGSGGRSSLAAAAAVFALGFSGAACKALGDVESDRLTGRETVAVALGRRRTRLLAALGAGAVLAGAAVSLALRNGPAGAAGLAVSGAGVLLAALRRRRPGDSLAVALWIDLSLLASGPVTALAWVVTRG